MYLSRLVVYIIIVISLNEFVIATIIDGSGNESQIIDGSGNEQIEPTEKRIFPSNSMDMTEAAGDKVIIINIWLSIIARLHYLHIV